METTQPDQSDSMSGELSAGGTRAAVKRSRKGGSDQPRKKRPIRKVITFVVLGLLILSAFGGALVFSMGGLSAIGNGPQHVDVGGFTFEYPKAWHRMHKADYPARSGGSELSAKGSIKLGTCPVLAKQQICRATLGQLHVLLFASNSLPDLANASQIFDRSLRSRFPHFRRLSSRPISTVDGTRALVYEFSFRQSEIPIREIVAMYPGAHTGALVIVQGTPAQVAHARHGLDSVLKSPEETQ